jgi:hypothetical protein
MLRPEQEASVTHQGPTMPTNKPVDVIAAHAATVPEEGSEQWALLHKGRGLPIPPHHEKHFAQPTTPELENFVTKWQQARVQVREGEHWKDLGPQEMDREELERRRELGLEPLSAGLTKQSNPVVNQPTIASGGPKMMTSQVSRPNEVIRVPLIAPGTYETRANIERQALSTTNQRLRHPYYKFVEPGTNVTSTAVRPMERAGAAPGIVPPVLAGQSREPPMTVIPSSTAIHDTETTSRWKTPPIATSQSTGSSAPGAEFSVTAREPQSVVHEAGQKTLHPTSTKLHPTTGPAEISMGVPVEQAALSARIAPAPLAAAGALPETTTPAAVVGQELLHPSAAGMTPGRTQAHEAVHHPLQTARAVGSEAIGHPTMQTRGVAHDIIQPSSSTMGSEAVGHPQSETRAAAHDVTHHPVQSARSELRPRSGATEVVDSAHDPHSREVGEVGGLTFGPGVPSHLNQSGNVIPQAEPSASTTETSTTTATPRERRHSKGLIDKLFHHHGK